MYVIGYHKIGTNDNFTPNIGNSEDMAYTNVNFVCFLIEGGKFSGSCPHSFIIKYLTLSLHYYWSDDRLRRSSLVSGWHCF